MNKAPTLLITLFALLVSYGAMSETTMDEEIKKAEASLEYTPSQTLLIQESNPQNNDGNSDSDLDALEEYAASIVMDAATGSIFSACTLNPFKLCSGPRPGKKHKFLRACWNVVCP